MATIEAAGVLFITPQGRGLFLLRGPGDAAYTWGLPGGQVSLTLLEEVSAAHRRALETDAEDVRRFLGLARPATR